MTKSLKELILVAEFAVFLAIFSQITIPFGLVPFTGQTFAVGVLATLLGKRLGTLSVLIYLLLGVLGLPVYAGMSSGLASLFGPTGGYLIGFLANTVITGAILERKGFTHVWGIIANILGALATLVFGTIWLKLSMNLAWSDAFLSGMIPFLIPGILKAVAASYLGILIRNRLPERFFGSLT